MSKKTAIYWPGYSLQTLRRTRCELIQTAHAADEKGPLWNAVADSHRETIAEIEAAISYMEGRDALLRRAGA
jgi:hypothetical protein